MKKRKLNYVSIFSGGGGMDLGFHNAGFKGLFATDYWQPACDTLIENNYIKEVECNDIRKIDFSRIKKKNGNIDCLIGGPPCPAYSKSRFYLTDKKRAMEDENSFTLKEYFRALKELTPKVFLFENVAGFVFKPHQDAFDFLKEKSELLGYDIEYRVVNCAEYGIPQTRERFFCVGVKKGEKNFTFPNETHSNPKKPIEGTNKWVTCGDVLSDIDYSLPEDDKMQAGSRHKDLLKLVPPGDNYLFFTEKRGYPSPIFKWRSRYWSFLLKLSKDRPSWTIQASHSNNMGPFHWNNRFLRIPEIKRIQTFDDSYNITGSFKDQWRQIGNAVPSRMAEILAKNIIHQYFK